MSTTAEDLDLITVEELSVILRVPRKSLYNYIRRGEIPGVRRLGRHFRIHKPTIVEWAKGGACKPEGET